jgi:hypothetical protein
MTEVTTRSGGVQKAQDANSMTEVTTRSGEVVEMTSTVIVFGIFVWAAILLLVAMFAK